MTFVRYLFLCQNFSQRITWVSNKKKMITQALPSTNLGQKSHMTILFNFSVWHGLLKKIKIQHGQKTRPIGTLTNLSSFEVNYRSWARIDASLFLIDMADTIDFSSQDNEDLPPSIDSLSPASCRLHVFLLPSNNFMAFWVLLLLTNVGVIKDDRFQDW